jgi:hypothetical protein
MQMSLGEKAMLKVSSDDGYGSRGAGGVIPPNADLHVSYLSVRPILAKSRSSNNFSPFHISSKWNSSKLINILIRLCSIMQ